MRRRKFPITAAQLRDDYVVHRMTQRDIAAKYGVTQTAVKDAMQRHGIPARPHGPTQAERDRILALREAGYSWRLICHYTGLSEGKIQTTIRGSKLLGNVTTRFRKPYAAEYPDAEPMIG